MQTFKAFYTRPHNIQVVELGQELKPLETQTYVLLERMLLLMGIYYRYVNDYCDINHIPHFEKKGFAMDLEGGPKSFLMILAGKALVKGAQKHSL